MQKFLQKIRELEGDINPELLKDIIAAHKEDRKRMINLYERYKASSKGVPILSRSLIDYEDFGPKTMKRIDNKVNNKLNNAFEADIVDTKIGYFLGHPITYDFDDGKEAGTSKIKDDIDVFNLRNHVEDEDSELGKMATICGYGARLAYIEKDTGYERIKNIDPWQVIFLGDDIHEPEYSIRYYDGFDNETYAEFYNETEIIFLKSEKGKFEEKDRQDHLFEFNPLYGLANNKELQGDFEKVLALIDAYNRTLSDASNEIEQYRLAYLVLKGLTADDDVDMRHKKVIELLGEHDDVSYLTKDINDALIEHHLDRLEKNILRFAKSIDFTDESFGGNITGEALKQKLRALENKCITMERKFTAMLRYQYKVIFSARAKRSSVDKEDYLKVWFAFKRNNPTNILEEAQATQALRGQVSEKTRLSTLSIVDDVEFELEEMQKEKDEYMSSLNIDDEDNLDE
ncbi:phage portal protein [Metabacillus litoralis]|uniref:phage portal protein n=1 Tax=Metabacillus litoralis TaxID=152268 RepID=UPI00203AFF97|nr:phage portal protein [Metabacillus litoralis]MCM3413534.1 phage portal protein [Metabacillus litoralis]